MHKTNNNGNGERGIVKQTHDVEDGLAQLVEEEPWLKSLREAMGSSVQGEDLKAIMAVQIAKAKEGDRRAADFVFKQAHQIMRGQRRDVTIVQNNYYGDDNPDAPPETAPRLDGEPASDATINRLRARVASHRPTGNGGPRPVSDEEEKEMRRREAEADDE